MIPPRCTCRHVCTLDSAALVAAALTLGARVFVSFDDRRRKIARRARLKVLPRIRP